MDGYRISVSTRVVAGVVLGLLALLPWYRLNISPSVPVGLYRLTAVPAPLRAGDIVVLPVPASVAAWQSRWVALLKPVAALAGDMVCVVDAGLQIGGVNYGPVYAEAHGRALPQLDTGCQPVPDGHVFLATPTPKSLDGRYWGFTPITTFTARALPVWTWR